uniref:Innexin n=1 Tax=Parascaris univalens TaxID=6257 RepID=A0A914ZSF0_PARUN
HRMMYNATLEFLSVARHKRNSSHRKFLFLSQLMNDSGKVRNALEKMLQLIFRIFIACGIFSYLLRQFYCLVAKCIYLVVNDALVPQDDVSIEYWGRGGRVMLEISDSLQIRP